MAQAVERFLLRLWRGQAMEFTYPGLVESFHRVLVIMPRSPEHRRLAHKWRAQIERALARKQVQFLDWTDEDAADGFLLLPRDVKFGRVVSGNVIRKIRSGKFTVSIDLSPQVDFLTAQIPLRAKIPARVGIDTTNSDLAEKFFNIILRTDFEDEYEPLVRFLAPRGR